MTRLLFKKYYMFIVLSFVALHLFGCNNEARINEGMVDEGEVSLFMEVLLPADMTGQPLSRGMTPEEELVVEEVDVYHFVDLEDNGNFVGVTTTPLSGSYSDGQQDFIHVTLNTYPGKKSRLIFVINACSEKYGYYYHMPFDDFVKSMIYEQLDEWRSARGDCDALPMYGYTGDVEIKKDLPNNRLDDNGKPFPLIRMHAKFNVSLSEKLIEEGYFQLKSVCLFNRKTHGHVNYHLDLWDPQHASGPLVTGPHIPAAAGTVYEPPAPYFTVCTDNSRSDYGMIVNKQYALEADNTNEPDRLKKTALVIGGIYGNDIKESYYRLDIDEEITGGNILRNHLYDIEIQSVAGRGEETPREAFEGMTHINAVITPWNLASQNTGIEKQYRLVIDVDEAYCYSTPRQHVDVHAETDYPGGIYVSENDVIYLTEQTGWILVLVEGGENQDGFLVRDFTISVPTNESGFVRSAKVQVHAGNLTKTIHITQGVDPAP